MSPFTLFYRVIPMICLIMLIINLFIDSNALLIVTTIIMVIDVLIAMLAKKKAKNRKTE